MSLEKPMKKLSISSNTRKLLEISKHVTKGELKTLKILCSDDIPAGILEEITTVLDLFKKVEELDDTGDGGKEFLLDLLKTIDRDDLCRMLNGLPKNDDGNITKNNPKYGIEKGVLLLVAKKISVDWRRLGRYLDVDDDVINQIDGDHAKIFDKAYELLREWVKKDIDNATLENLTQTLERMRRMDIVHEIKEKKSINNSTTCKPLQETEVNQDEARDSPSNISNNNAQAGNSSSDANSSAQPQPATHQASDSKYNIKNFGGTVFVGESNIVTIHQIRSPAATSAPNNQGNVPPENNSSSKFNVTVLEGFATVGEDNHVTINNAKPDVDSVNKGSEENEEKNSHETAV